MCMRAIYPILLSCTRANSNSKGTVIYHMEVESLSAPARNNVLHPRVVVVALNAAKPFKCCAIESIYICEENIYIMT